MQPEEEASELSCSQKQNALQQQLYLVSEAS
jgi:hypothetical protein